MTKHGTDVPSQGADNNILGSSDAPKVGTQHMQISRWKPLHATCHESKHAHFYHSCFRGGVIRLQNDDEVNKFNTFALFLSRLIF